MTVPRIARLSAQRIVKMVAVILAIAVTNFLLIHAAPGDPASVIAGQSGAADPQMLAQLRAQFGLDKPLTTQLAIYVGHVLQGDLGTSFRQGRPVLGLILERLPATLLLTGTAFV
ncbi:MAG: ABC transporter permease, partial [Rhodospirillales bacterium]|nr:ABC transporter permease [Rhodospirillales bacterium]